MARKSKSKSARIWYARYAGDYARKTKHLSLAEHGAYALLMDWYYSNEKPLPLERVQLHRICTAVAEHEQAAVQNILQQFFEETPDGYRNQRIDEEINHKHDISEKRRNAQAERERKRKEKQGFISVDALQKIHEAGHKIYGPGGKRGGADDAANDGTNGGAFAPTTTTTTKEGINPLPPNNPQAVDNGDDSPGRPFDVERHLTDADRTRFKQIAQGQSIYFYIAEYNAWMAKGAKKQPHFPGKHFLQWTETYFKNQNQKGD